VIRSKTLFVNFGRMTRVEGIGAVVSLAMVYNDLVTINWALARFNEAKPSLGEYLHKGMRIYFSRIHNGHLAEGMRAVQKIHANKAMRRIVSKCSLDCQKAFEELCGCLPGGTEHLSFGLYVEQVRNRVAFHCDDSYLRWAVKSRAKRVGGSTSTLTAGGTAHSNRFEFVDDLLDTVVCRKVWRIRGGRGLRTRADRVGAWCDLKARQYLRFSGEFVEAALRELNLLC